MVGASDLLLRVCPIGAPHRTVHEAFRELEAIRGRGHTGTVVVELCEGVHPHASALRLGPEHTGDLGSTVLRGAGNGAFLDGGHVVSGWSEDHTHPFGLRLWRARLPAGVPASRQLWVNGRRAVRAHATNSSCSGGPVVPTLRCPRPISGNLSAEGYTSVPTRSPYGSAPLGEWLVGVEFVYGRGASGAPWTEPRCSVAAVRGGEGDETIDVVMDPLCWAMARSKGAQSVGFPSDIENALELLDEPGEWFARYDEGVVYYAPTPGDEMESVSAILGGVPTGSIGGEAVAITAGARGVSITNLGFRHLTWLGPSGAGGFVDLQSGYYLAKPMGGSTTSAALRGVPGALAFHGASHALVRNCKFEHLGLSGVLTDGGSQHVSVDGCVFSDLSGSAVSLGNVSHPLLPPPLQDAWLGVASSRIRDTGQEYRGCAAIVAGYVSHVSLLRNEINASSNGAICLGWGWGATNSMRGNNVSFNRISRSNDFLVDCGSIYTLSSQPNSTISFNYIREQVLLYGSLYHDARSAGFHTHHNVVEGGPMWLYLQHGSMGPVDHLTIEDNYHNTETAGGCALPQFADTCQASGYCPDHYPPSTCGGLVIRRNVLVSGATWPAEARRIMARAGPGPHVARSSTVPVEL